MSGRVYGLCRGRNVVRTIVVVVSAAALAMPVVVAAPATAASARVMAAHTGQPTTRTQVSAAAASVAASRGYHIGIAVYDTVTGRTYTAGDGYGQFATESVIKVMIASRLLVDGAMYGSTARVAYKMITQSDDGSADELYGRAGGDGLITWTKNYFHVANLGTPPQRAGYWGNTHVTPVGLVHLYAKLLTDRRVAPWLLNAMHHARQYGSDGTYQFFGIASASKNAAIKQGWGCDFSPSCSDADFNSTGFVDNNRYAVALLGRGPLSTYGRPISDMLTAVARTLLPHGDFPPAAPTVGTVSATLSPVSGGRRITIRGTDFSRVRSVSFGRLRAQQVTVVSSRMLRVTVPRHAPATIFITVHTAYGSSAPTPRARFSFVAPPTLSRVSAMYGTSAGGTSITLLGRNLSSVRSVTIGGTRARRVSVVSAHLLRIVTPAHPAATVHIRVSTRFGRSAATAGRFTYVAAPTISLLSPSVITRTATRVKITGTGFVRVRAVEFDGHPATGLTSTSSTGLTVTAPAHRAGSVRVRVITEFGTSAAATLTYTAPPVVATSSLPAGHVGERYSASLATQDGREGTWAITVATLPAGLSLTGSSIGGTPTTAGSSTFTVTFTDRFGRSTSRQLEVSVQ